MRVDGSERGFIPLLIQNSQHVAVVDFQLSAQAAQVLIQLEQWLSEEFKVLWGFIGLFEAK